MRLFLLHLRRGLHPGFGIALVAIALFVRFGADVPPAAGLGASDPDAIVRGLRRADLLTAMLFVLIPFTTIQGLRNWSKKEGRERAWLLSGPTSKVKLVLCSWAGNWCAAVFWLYVTLGLCETLTSSEAQEWRAAGDIQMEQVERRGDAGDLRWNSPIPHHEGPLRLQLEVGLFGSDADLDEFVLQSFDADGGSVVDEFRAQPGRITILEVDIPSGQERVAMELGTVGARRSLLLNNPRLQLFVATKPAIPTWLVIERVAMQLAVLQALALGLFAWFSSATSLTYVFSAYLLVWLEADRWSQAAFATWLPGFDLPVAIDWIAQGRGPTHVPLATWVGALALVAAGLASVTVGLGRWRAGR